MTNTNTTNTSSKNNNNTTNTTNTNNALCYITLCLEDVDEDCQLLPELLLDGLVLHMYLCI